jgi:hypothetical protein
MNVMNPFCEKKVQVTKADDISPGNAMDKQLRLQAKVKSNKKRKIDS